eukprot:gene7072-7869_t
MLRKFISLGPKGCQIFASNLRSCQIVTQVSSQSFGSNNGIAEELQKNTQNIQSVAEKSHNELKYAEKLIDSWISSAKLHPEDRLKNILEFCNSKNDETYQSSVGEKIYMWCTGVLTVSSLLLCKSWFSSQHQKVKNPSWLNPDVVESVIKNYFWGIPRDHLLLSVKATEKKEKKSSKERIYDVADKFKATSDHCTASILNKLGLQMLSVNQPKQAAEFFEKAAEIGHMSAIYNMGLCFDQGKGVPQNHVKAAQFYEIAADKGHPKAQFNLATLFAEGPGGVKRDANRAIAMLERAAENGITKAQVHMAFYLAKESNHEKAVKYFKMASEAKDAVAMYHLGICLENGLGVEKNIREAGKMYQEAAEGNHASAMYNTAIFYENGLGGMEKSCNKAIYWYEKCAENGDEDAAIKLEQLRRQKEVRNSYKMHPILRDIFMWKILNQTHHNHYDHHQGEFHKSKSTPNFQRNISEAFGLSKISNDDIFNYNSSKSFGSEMQPAISVYCYGKDSQELGLLPLEYKPKPEILQNIETKHQWARDDPAFLVLLSFWLFVSSIIFAVVLKLGFIGFIKFLLWVIFVDCIGVGLIIAGFLWLITNRYLRIPGDSSHDHVVEFGYSFDVHLNAFFPLLIILHIVQLIGLLFDPGMFIARFFGNTLWLVAITYYVYITFLGYSALPFLRNTAVLLYPFALLVMIYIISLSLSWNITQSLVDFYKYRVL